MDVDRPIRTKLRDVVRERREVAELTLRTEAIAERLRKRAKDARSAARLTIPMTVDELETMAADFEIMGKLGKHVHDALMKEELRSRPSEPIPVSG